MHSLSGQIPQLANLAWRYPAAAQFAAVEQPRDPLGILGICLIAIQTLDVLWVDQEQLFEMSFENIPYCTPILTRRFHRNFADLTVLQPGPELFQIAREGAKRSFPGFRFWPPRGGQHANRHALLVYVNAATAAIVLFLLFHNVPRGSPSEGRLEKGSMTFLRVFIRRCGDTVPGSSKRVLTRFTNGLLRAPTESRPHVSLGDLLPSSQACQVPHFHSSWWTRAARRGWVTFFFQKNSTRAQGFTRPFP